MATGTSKSDSDESGNRGEQIARISIKIPPLWRRNVKVWRLQVDAQFASSPVTQELTKYNYVLASLDGDVAELISDLLLKPLSNTPYTDLMIRLQTEFEISEGRKGKELVDLGRQNPIQEDEPAEKKTRSGPDRLQPTGGSSWLAAGCRTTRHRKDQDRLEHPGTNLGSSEDTG
ncbi:hypothetical protein GE061_013696 [Apolygus lucorum]|uniref:DUF7041 domain-containing protein n=1 Tax=Apolygus lucorum TaxID=248454 RepID=A0A8S9XNI5_APOLU|nr:hypothetical protein GE061_013696 [Apolygus lucorum]